MNTTLQAILEIIRFKDINEAVEIWNNNNN